MVKDREDEVAEAENEVWKLQIQKEQHFLQALFWRLAIFMQLPHGYSFVFPDDKIDKFALLKWDLMVQLASVT